MRSPVDGGRLGDVGDPGAQAAEPAGSPSTVTAPDSTIWTPTIARISVVFPVPLGPSSPVTAPRSISGDPRQDELLPRRTFEVRTEIAARAHRGGPYRGIAPA